MATTYISPKGAGLKDGSTAANAAPVTTLDAMVQRAGAGGTVLMLADVGSYNLGRTSISITHGGTAGQPVTIKGVDSAGHDMAATIVGNRPLDATAATQPGSQAFVMTGAASNLTFANFNISNVSNAFRVASDVSNIEIGHVVSTNVQRFFEDRQADSADGMTATISGLNIHDVTVAGYSKGVVRLQFDTHDVKLTNITGDSAGQTFDTFAIGVHLDGTVHDVVVDHVTMLNNQNFEGTYLNGDAFATEGGTHDIIFRDTVARGSTDGGYDLKSDNTMLIGVIAEDNGRNFRFWGNGNVMTDSIGLDPHSRADGGTGSQIWMRGGADVAISNSSFIDSGSNTKVFNYDGRAVITLDDVDIRYAETAVLKFGSGTLSGLASGDVAAVAATGAFSSGSATPATVGHDAAPPVQPEDQATGSFDSLRYAASNPDLARAFGTDESALSRHYLQYGRIEGRATDTFDALEYAASNPDLARAFGTDATALERHYIVNGLAEGRATDTFDALEYAASNPDLARAFGTDAAALERHYVLNGLAEGRATDTFDALEYAASNPDLARAFGTDAAALERHYIVNGLAEGRATDTFDALEYAASNPDLARAFGTDATALERHYIVNGLAEGRATDTFDPVAYLLSNDDLGTAELGAAGALRHWIDFGVEEGRAGGGLFGREQAHHDATVNSVTQDIIGTAGDKDWFAVSLHAGDTVRIELAAAGGAGNPLLDPLLELFDAGGHRLAADRDGGTDSTATIDYAVPTDGLYYLTASASDGHSFGAFSMSVDLLF